jgi:hypothetical protein
MRTTMETARLHRRNTRASGAFRPFIARAARFNQSTVTTVMVAPLRAMGVPLRRGVPPTSAPRMFAAECSERGAVVQPSPSASDPEERERGTLPKSRGLLVQHGVRIHPS